MCLICDRIEMIKRGENPYFVRELKTGYVVIGDHQHFRGYTLFLYKEHGDKTELFHLDKAERALFLEEMTIVAQAAAKAFGAEKMNYELLGMGDAHLHWPRQRRPRQLRQSRKGSCMVVSHGKDVQRRNPTES